MRAGPRTRRGAAGSEASEAGSMTRDADALNRRRRRRRRRKKDAREAGVCMPPAWRKWRDTGRGRGAERVRATAGDCYLLPWDYAKLYLLLRGAAW